jgi:zona occludens toxin (predicted ATPase)
VFRWSYASDWAVLARLGAGAGGGIQVDHNWLLWGKTRQDSIDAPDSVVVAKSFLAVTRTAARPQGYARHRRGKQDLFLTAIAISADWPALQSTAVPVRRLKRRTKTRKALLPMRSG